MKKINLISIILFVVAIIFIFIACCMIFLKQRTVICVQESKMTAMTQEISYDLKNNVKSILIKHEVTFERNEDYLNAKQKFQKKSNYQFNDESKSYIVTQKIDGNDNLLLENYLNHLKKDNYKCNKKS